MSETPEPVDPGKLVVDIISWLAFGIIMAIFIERTSSFGHLGGNPVYIGMGCLMGYRLRWITGQRSLKMAMIAVTGMVISLAISQLVFVIDIFILIMNNGGGARGMTFFKVIKESLEVLPNSYWIFVIGGLCACVFGAMQGKPRRSLQTSP